MSMNSVNDRIADASDDAADTGYILATVVDNVDPLGLGRIKVSVPNLFDHNQGPVPWIGPMKKSLFGIGNGYGVYGSPSIGSIVQIELQGGDPHYGMVTSDVYNVANAKFKDPNTWGYKDPSGNELFVNMTTGDWQFTHSSGSTSSYDTSGNLTAHTVGNANITVAGDAMVNVSGSTTLTCDNVTLNGNLAVSQNVTVGTGATGTFTSQDDKFITVQAGIITSIS